MSVNPKSQTQAQTKKQPTQNQSFLLIAVVILLLPPIIYLLLQYLVPNQASAAFVTVALIISLKIAFIVYIIRLSTNTTKVKAD